jgi:hypothetical protein
MVMIRNCCTALVLARNKNAILFKFCCLSLTHTHVMSVLGLNVACVKPDWLAAVVHLHGWRTKSPVSHPHDEQCIISAVALTC